MVRFAWFGIVGLAALSPRAAAQEKAPQRPWNVLFLVSDDLNNNLGAYGFPRAQTPHLDRLAAQGVRFDRAYCQFPLCNPSRSSFMTGRRPDHTGVYENRTHFRQKLPDVATLPQLFQQAGYFTARVGKIFHYGVPAQIGTDGADDKPSWQRAINPKGRDKTDEDLVVQYTGPNRVLGAAISFLAADGTDEEQTDGLIASETIQLLESSRERPFFLACGFFRPHVPCVAPKPWFEKHPRAQQSLPQEPAAHLRGIPDLAFWTKPRNYGLAEEKLLDFVQAYHASVSFMDAQVGRVLAALDRLKLSERTIVVFLSDHGYLLGEHGQWQKMSLFEPSARVPLLIRVPGAAGNGQATTRCVELIDLYPTLAELCGLKAPGADGRSLRALLENPASAWDRPAYTQVTRGVPVATNEKPEPGQRAVMGRSVRTSRWRYSEWDEGRQGAELYDHDTDPRELQNLASDPRHAAQRGELRELLYAPLKSVSK